MVAKTLARYRKRKDTIRVELYSFVGHNEFYCSDNRSGNNKNVPAQKDVIKSEPDFIALDDPVGIRPHFVMEEYLIQHQNTVTENLNEKTHDNQDTRSIQVIQ